NLVVVRSRARDGVVDDLPDVARPDVYARKAITARVRAPPAGERINAESVYGRNDPFREIPCLLIEGKDGRVRTLIASFRKVTHFIAFFVFSVWWETRVAGIV